MVKTIKSCEIELVSTCFKEEGNKAVIWRLTAGAWNKATTLDVVKTMVSLARPQH